MGVDTDAERIVQTSIEHRRRAATRWAIFAAYFSTGLNLVQGILLVPLYVHYIPVPLYGAWLATGNILVWVLLIDPGYSEVVQQRVGHSYGTGDHRLVGEYAGIGLFMSVLISLAVVIIGAAVFPWLGWITNLPAADLAALREAYLFALLGTACTMMSFGSMAINLGLLGGFGLYALTVVGNIAGILMILWSLVNNLGVLSLGLGAFARGFGLLVCGLGYWLWRWRMEKLKLSWNWHRLREMLGLTGTFFIGKLTNQLSDNVSAVLLARYLGAVHVPVYALTERGITLARSLAIRYSSAIMPTLTNLNGAGQYDQARILVLRLSHASSWNMGLLLAGFLALNQQFVSLWVGERLYAGHTVNALLCLGGVATMMTSIFRNLLIALGYIRQFSHVMTVQSVLSIGLMWLGGKYYGMVGMAVAPLAAALLTGLWLGPWFVLQHLQASGTDLRDMLREMGTAFGCGLLTAIVLSHVPEGTGWAGFGGRTVLDVALYAVLLTSMSARFRRLLRRVVSEGLLRMAFAR